MPEQEWRCWCGGEQAADGCCENDPWHLAEPIIRPALAEAFARRLGADDFEAWSDDL